MTPSWLSLLFVLLLCMLVLNTSVFVKTDCCSVGNFLLSPVSSSGCSASWFLKDLHCRYPVLSLDASTLHGCPSVCVPRSNPLLPVERQSSVRIHDKGYLYIKGKVLEVHPELVTVFIVDVFITRMVDFSSQQGFHLRYLEGVSSSPVRNSVSPWFSESRLATYQAVVIWLYTLFRLRSLLFCKVYRPECPSLVHIKDFSWFVLLPLISLCVQPRDVVFYCVRARYFHQVKVRKHCLMEGLPSRPSNGRC